MHIQFGPIANMVLNAEVRIVGVRAGRVFSAFRAYLIWSHALVIKDFEGWVGKVLRLQWDMRHDISVVHYSYNFRQSRLDILCQLLISKAWTSESMQLAYQLVFNLDF